MKKYRISLLLAVCICSLVLALSVLFVSYTGKAYANPTSIETINFGNSGFSTSSAGSVENLIEELGGSSYNELSNQVASSGAKNAIEFASAKTVTMGGFEWNIVYLSKADYTVNGTNAGDLIVTLWLAGAYSNLTSTYSANNILSNNGWDPYPTNMYSSSYLRSSLVGSNYLTAAGLSTLDGVGEINDAWKPFSNGTSGAEGAFYNVLATPANLRWQEKISAVEMNIHTRNIPNEAWGVPDTVIWYSEEMNYTERTDYTVWKDDRIWLPTISETGTNGENGLWKTTSTQRKNTANITVYYRSGSDTLAGSQTTLKSSGENSGAPVYDKLGVRPAVHLNLKSVITAAGVDPDGHTHTLGEYTVSQAATCSTTGTKTATCTECGNSVEEEIPVDPSAHTWGEWSVTTAPTCSLAGAESRVCSLNASHTESRPKAELGHNWSTAWSKDATNHWHECTRDCGAKDGETAHTFNWVVDTPATVTTTGIKHEECVCGQRQSENTVIPVETCTHTNKTHHAAVAATCVATGTQEYWTCNDCNKNLDSSNIETTTIITPIDPDNHVAFGAWQIETAATCTETGTEKRICADCNHEETRELAIDPIAHDIEHHEAQAATCTEAGWAEYDTCTRCDYTTYSEIAALGHDWSSEWSKDETNHWHECTRGCDEINDQAAHTYDWVITKQPTENEEGEKEEHCTVCEYANGNTEAIAKLVTDPDGNGDVIDLPVLPPNQDYDLEIAVKESESKYNIDGINKGYLVELFIVDGDNRNPYDNSRTVTLTLLIPDGMEDFTLYKMSGDRLTEISAESYTVRGRIVTIRTTLPSEFVFNAPEPEEPSAGIPWWVWLIVGLVVVAIVGVIIIIIVVAKKKNNDGGTPTDNGELLSRLDSQEQKIDELLNRDDGGFNTPVELDENGNVIFK